MLTRRLSLPCRSYECGSRSSLVCIARRLGLQLLPGGPPKASRAPIGPSAAAKREGEPAANVPPEEAGTVPSPVKRSSSPRQSRRDGQAEGGLEEPLKTRKARARAPGGAGATPKVRKSRAGNPGGAGEPTEAGVPGEPGELGKVRKPRGRAKKGDPASPDAGQTSAGALNGAVLTAFNEQGWEAPPEIGEGLLIDASEKAESVAATEKAELDVASDKAALVDASETAEAVDALEKVESAAEVSTPAAASSVEASSARRSTPSRLEELAQAPVGAMEGGVGDREGFGEGSAGSGTDTAPSAVHDRTQASPLAVQAGDVQPELENPEGGEGISGMGTPDATTGKQKAPKKKGLPRAKPLPKSGKKVKVGSSNSSKAAENVDSSKVLDSVEVAAAGVPSASLSEAAPKAPLDAEISVGDAGKAIDYWGLWRLNYESRRLFL
eukprot:jgi/Botrbrau1/1800/Bobra.0217s0051.1